MPGFPPCQLAASLRSETKPSWRWISVNCCCLIQRAASPLPKSKQQQVLPDWPRPGLCIRHVHVMSPEKWDSAAWINSANGADLRNFILHDWANSCAHGEGKRIMLGTAPANRTKRYLFPHGASLLFSKESTVIIPAEQLFQRLFAGSLWNTELVFSTYFALETTLSTFLSLRRGKYGKTVWMII